MYRFMRMKRLTEVVDDGNLHASIKTG